MSPFGRRVDATERDAQRAQKAEARQREAEEEAFRRSPAGKAHASRRAGHTVFQLSVDLDDPYLRSAEHSGISAQLSEIVAQGWQLHSFSTAFVGSGEATLTHLGNQYSSQSGNLIATYVFVRHPINTRPERSRDHDG